MEGLLESEMLPQIAGAMGVACGLVLMLAHKRLGLLCHGYLQAASEEDETDEEEDESEDVEREGRCRGRRASPRGRKQRRGS